MVASGDGQCRIIMQDSVLLPGMSMPVLGPPPPDPHPNPKVQAIRDAWCLKIIAWECVFATHRPAHLVYRAAADHWRDPNTPRRPPMLEPEDDHDE